MLFMAEKLQRGTWPFTIFGPVTLAGLLGIVLCDGIWVVVSAAAAGLGAAVTFIVTFGLPAILSPPGEVHRMAGGMFTISYTIAVIVPVSAARAGISPDCPGPRSCRWRPARSS